MICIKILLEQKINGQNCKVLDEMQIDMALDILYNSIIKRGERKGVRI